MKQISNIVKLIPLTNVTSIYGNSYVLGNEAKVLKFTSTQDVDFKQEPNTEDFGQSYEQTFKAVAPAGAIGIMEFNNNKAIVVLALTGGTERVIGDKDVPCRIIITPYSGKYVVEFKRTALNPLEL